MAETIHDTIVREVSAWPGVTTGRHRFGGTEFRYGRRELGHLHGDRLADLPFPLLVRDELVAAGRAEAHHIFPESGELRPAVGGIVAPSLRRSISLTTVSRFNTSTTISSGATLDNVVEEGAPASSRPTSTTTPVARTFEIASFDAMFAANVHGRPPRARRPNRDLGVESPAEEGSLL